MEVLAGGGSPIWKILIFFLIMPLAVAAFVFLNTEKIVSFWPAIGLAGLGFLLMYYLSTRVFMMV